MQPIDSPEFGIIISQDQICAVWPAGMKPPPGWRFTGDRGPKSAMQDRVDQQFVATAPALLHDLDRRYRGAEWAAAEFDE